MAETKRVPLRDRVNGEWTAFESQLFNLVTQQREIDMPKLYFSGRLELVQIMLDALDSHLAALRRSQNDILP